MPISFSGEATFIAEQKDSANMYHRRLLFSYSRRSGEGTERCLLTTLITTKSYWKYRSFLKKGVTVRLHGEERNVIVKGTIRSIHFIIFIFVWNDELKKYTLIPEDLEQKRAQAKKTQQERREKRKLEAPKQEKQKRPPGRPRKQESVKEPEEEVFDEIIYSNEDEQEIEYDEYGDPIQ